MEKGCLIEIDKLSKVFTLREGFRKTRRVMAVDNVSFAVSPGETVALTGESGSGKTTVGRIVLGLLKPSSGQVTYKGQAVSTLAGKPAKDFRRSVQAVFQDPSLSLNPRMIVQEILAEPLKNFALSRDVREETFVLLEQVGLTREFAFRYPHQCSGGQKQRISIARALAVKPQLIILDEPLSALDITVQTKIINLLNELKALYGMSYLFITHDLKAVRAMADRILVMYRGRVVETAGIGDFIKSPVHPHSQALLAATPKLDG